MNSNQVNQRSMNLQTIPDDLLEKNSSTYNKDPAQSAADNSKHLSATAHNEITANEDTVIPAVSNKNLNLKEMPDANKNGNSRNLQMFDTSVNTMNGIT